MGQALDPRRTTLAVEDDPDGRSLAAAVLEEADLRVVEAKMARNA